MTKSSFKWLLGQKEKNTPKHILTDDKLFERLVEKMMNDMGFNEEARKAFQQKSKPDKEALVLPWLKKSHSQSVQGYFKFKLYEKPTELTQILVNLHQRNSKLT